jgi:DNA-binding PadR family transcriptional regulator
MNRVIELMILGFLAEGPQHGYELRRRMEELIGYARPISFGTLYPAISRLVKAGLLHQSAAPGKAGATRVTLTLTGAGRLSLNERLRSASATDITDGHRFMVVLAFLSRLPAQAERNAVLQRRLDFLSHPASFFSDSDHPLTSADIEDPYRQGILVSAKATSRAERAWLTYMLAAPTT